MPDKLLTPFFKNPNKFLLIMSLGHTLSFVVFAIYSTQHFLPYWVHIFPSHLWGEGVALFCQIVVIGMLSIWVSEILPKPFFLINPDYTLERLALPISIAYFLLYYTFGYPTLWAYRRSLELLNLQYEEQKPVYRMSDLRRYFNESNSTPSPAREGEEEENPEIPLTNELIGNALDFKGVLVRDCMIPKEELVMVEENETAEAVHNQTITTGHSKILVYRGSPNNIIGYTHPVGMLRGHMAAWNSQILPILRTLPTEKANTLLMKLNQDKKTLALVVNEQQDVLGLVSVEDLMEEIFGEIEDEYDN